MTGIGGPRPDARLPKAVRTSYTFFLRDRYHAAEYAADSRQDKFRNIAAAWNKLSEQERKVRRCPPPRAGESVIPREDRPG